MRRLPAALALATAAALALTGSTTAAAPAAPAATVPSLQVTRMVTGLDIPWDVKPIGTDTYLITERAGRLLLWRNGTLRQVAFPGKVWARGETGLMGLAIDPQFSSNRRFYTCSGGTMSSGKHDVRVTRWRLDDDSTGVTLQRHLLVGLPATSGRHGGCRLLITSYGALLVGTGDAATGRNPRDLHSLGGKVLRLNRTTGAPWPTNPFVHSKLVRTRYVLTFGHRNVQGLSQRRDGTLWSVEQGTTRDDEVNWLHAGGDYGYNPVPGYNESVPMTNSKLPGLQYVARWRSGYPTLATSGGSWVNGSQWGALDNTLAVAALKAQRLLFLSFNSKEQLTAVRTPSALRKYGRLRSITQIAGGDLLVTTSNGNGQDSILRVHPQP